MITPSPKDRYHIAGENMLPKDHCNVLLCLFTIDHVTVHRFTLTVTLDKISRTLKRGGVLVTMYFDSKKLVQLMESRAVEKLSFMNFEKGSECSSKTLDISHSYAEILLRPIDFSSKSGMDNGLINL